MTQQYTPFNSSLLHTGFPLITILSIMLLMASLSCFSQQGVTERSELPNATAIRSIIIHPVVEGKFKASDHHLGQFKGSLGDELGKDVLVVEYAGGPNKRFPAFYKNEGTSNEDWYGWNQRVLAPFEGKVIRVYVNQEVNKPGSKGEGRASSIIFERVDGTRVVYGHVQNIKVKEGDQVTAGQHVAHVGNNGFAWMPHIHVGAWKDKEPLQIVFDLKALGELYDK